MSEAQTRASASPSFLADWRRYIPYLGFVLIFAFFSATLFNQGFLQPNNLLNILRQTAMISVMSVGMTYVLAAGEIDLSIGMVAGLISLVTAVVMDQLGAFAGVVAGLAAGAGVGVVNALLTTKVGIPSFLATLAMMGIARGAAMWMTQTKSVPILDDNYNWLFGGGNFGPVPVLVIWTLVIAAAGHVVLRRTTFGRRVLATGGGETAARYSGIDTAGTKRAVLILSSLGAAVAGMLYAGRLHSGRVSAWGRRRAQCDRRLRARRNEFVRRGWHRGRIDRRLADDRRHQQRPVADGSGVQPAVDRTRRHHHRGGGDQPIEKIGARAHDDPATENAAR